MKTGLGLYRKYRFLIAYVNLFRFWIRKVFIGFDVANLFIQRVDKYSVSLILRKFGAKIGNNCDIETGIVFHNCRNYSNLVLGNNCHIGKNCFFDLREKVIIGDNVVVSMRVSFITHMDMNKSKLTLIYPKKQQPVNVHANSYIGADSTILMRVNLGEDSFIAAGALVSKNVESRTMVGGIPAIVIKKIDYPVSEE